MGGGVGGWWCYGWMVVWVGGSFVGGWWCGWVVVLWVGGWVYVMD